MSNLRDDYNNGWMDWVVGYIKEWTDRWMDGWMDE